MLRIIDQKQGFHLSVEIELQRFELDNRSKLDLHALLINLGSFVYRLKNEGFLVELRQSFRLYEPGEKIPFPWTTIPNDPTLMDGFFRSNDDLNAFFDVPEAEFQRRARYHTLICK